MFDKTIDTLKSAFSSLEWPGFIAMNLDDDICILTVKIHHDIRWLEGHFPGQPVLAGVVQTHWAGSLCQYIFSIDDPFVGIDNLKFQSVIMPEKELDIRLEYNREKNTVKFRFYDELAVYSEGKIAFANT